MILLEQTGKVRIECIKCGEVDIPNIRKSHFAREQLYKVSCAHCGKYIKFINESQLKAGVYAISGEYLGDQQGTLHETGQVVPLKGKRAAVRYEGEKVLAQFDDRALVEAYGWREFSAEEWMY